MRLTVVALVFAAITGAIGFSGVWTEAADYFRLLSTLFLVVFFGLYIGTRKARQAG